MQEVIKEVIQETQDVFSTYDSSNMHLMLNTIQSSLELVEKITINPKTHNDELAFTLNKSYSKIAYLADAILRPFSAGAVISVRAMPLISAARFYKIKSFDIDAALDARKAFFTNLISSIQEKQPTCLDDYLSSQDFKMWFKLQKVSYKNNILKELEEKQDVFIKIILDLNSSNISKEDAALLLSIPKSTIYHATLKVLSSILNSYPDFQSSLSFYNHKANTEFIKKIVGLFPKKSNNDSQEEQPVAYLDRSVYRINGELIDLSKIYQNQIDKFTKLLNLYESYYATPAETPIEQEVDVGFIQEPPPSQGDAEIDLIFPVQPQQVDFAEISNELTKYIKQYSSNLNHHKLEIAHEKFANTIKILEEFNKKIKTTKGINKSLLTYAWVTKFLAEQETETLKIKFIEFKNLLLNLKSEFSLSSVFGASTYVFQEIKEDTVENAISRQQEEFSILIQGLKLDQVADSDLGIDDASFMSDVSTETPVDIDEPGERRDSLLKKSIYLCKKIENYLQSMEIAINSFSAEDFFTGDLYECEERNILTYVAHLSSIYPSDFKDCSFYNFLQKLPDSLIQKRRDLLSSRLNNIQEEVKLYLASKCQKVCEINQKFSSLPSVDIKHFDNLLRNIKSEIREVAVIDARLNLLNINHDFKLPTESAIDDVEKQHNLQVAKTRRQEMTSRTTKKYCEFRTSYLHDASRNQFFDNKILPEVGKYVESPDYDKNTLITLIDSALKKYSNLRLKSCLYGLKADLLDSDSNTKIQLQGISELQIKRKIKSASKNIKPSMKNIYDLLVKANLHQSELVVYLNDFLGAKNKKEAYLGFRDKFITRLHSYDFEMSAQDKKWSERKSTIIMAICTLGIALGISYAVTKITTGKAYLFWETTHKQEAVNKIIESLPTKLFS